MTPVPIITPFVRNDGTVIDAVMADSLRRASPARFSGSDLSRFSGATRLRSRPAPQPSNNLGPRPCGCKDFVGLRCVVCRAVGGLVRRRIGEANVNRRFNICSFSATFIITDYVGHQLMAHILLVEDDADVRAVVSDLLATLGHQVTSASSAEQARLLLASEPVDLALIDCLMSGEQGNSLAEHASGLNVPTILTSGDPHYIETRTEHPFPFLPKPFRLTSLDELIESTLHKSGPDQ